MARRSGSSRSGFRGFTNFTDWLGGQTERADQVGEFARGAAADPDWPRRRTTLLAYVAYLAERDGLNFPREPLDAAWREYEAATEAAAFNASPRQRR